MPPDPDEGFIITGKVPVKPKEAPAPAPGAAPAAADEGFIVTAPSGAQGEAKATAPPPDIGGQPSGRPGGVVGARHGTMVQGPWSNAPGDTWADSLYKGGGTALMRAIMMPVGLYGDIRELGTYAANRAEAAIKGIPYEDQARISRENKERLKNSGASWQKAIPDVTGSLPTTAELSDEALRQSGMGRYDPTSTLGKVVQGTAEAVLGGSGLTGLTGTKITSSAVPSNVMKLADKSAVPAGAAGAASTAATEITGDPLVGMAVGVPVGAATGYVADKSSVKVPSPGKMVVDTASDPAAVAGYRRDPNELAPATTGTATGDTGLIVAEKTIAATDTPFKDQQKKILEAENTARVVAIKDLGDPNVQPKDLADYMVTRRDAITADENAKVAAAEARQRAATTPEGKPIEEVGAKAREEVAALAEKSRNERNALYDAVDPDGKLHAVADDLTTAAEKLNASRDPHIPPDQSIGPFVQPVLEAMQKLPRVVPFQTLKNFDVWVGNQIQMAHKAGDLNAARQLTDLQKGIDKGMTNVLENQIKWEQGQVKAGNMRPEDTIGARFKADAESFIAQRQGEKSAAVASIAGLDVLPPTPNLDPAAVRRYEAAKRAHQTHAQTFQEGVIGDVLAKSGYENKQTAAQVAANLFKPGDEGATNIQSWMRAAATSDNPGAVHAVAVDAATTRLQAMLGPDGVLTPEILAKYKARYGNALRAMDEHVPGFSQRFDSAAAATQALGEATAARTTAVENFQKSQAGKLAGVTSDDEVINLVGKLINSDTGPTQLSELMANAKPHELAGIQVAARDFLLRATANAGMAGGESLMSGAKTSALVRKRSDALRRIFGDEGFENIQRVIDNMERSQSAYTKGAEAGSDTATKIQPVIEDVRKPIPGILPPATADTVFKTIFTGGTGLALEVIGNIRERMRLQGIRDSYELFKAAMLDPELAAAFAQRGLDERGQPNMGAYSAIAAALQARQAANAITPHEETERNERQGRASGGRVKLDCAGKAAALCREADRIRRKHAADTRILLNQSDDAVADALAVASRGL